MCIISPDGEDDSGPYQEYPVNAAEGIIPGKIQRKEHLLIYLVFWLGEDSSLRNSEQWKKWEKKWKKWKLDQVNCAKVKYSHYIVYLKNLHPLKKITVEKYLSLKVSRPWKIFTHEKYSPLKNNHPWKIFTPKKY